MTSQAALVSASPPTSTTRKRSSSSWSPAFEPAPAPRCTSTARGRLAHVSDSRAAYCRVRSTDRSARQRRQLAERTRTDLTRALHFDEAPRLGVVDVAEDRN